MKVLRSIVVRVPRQRRRSFIAFVGANGRIVRQDITSWSLGPDGKRVTDDRVH